MKTTAFLCGTLLALGILVAGCAQSQAPTLAPAPGATQAREPAVDRWDKTLALARQEGKVTVYGELGPEARTGLMTAFQKKYGIELETVTGTGPEMANKYLQEVASGIYLADVLFNGDLTFLNVIKPKGVLVPIDPYLMLPEIKDPRAWPKGGVPFLDKDRLVIASTVGRNPFAMVNTDLVKQGDMESFQDYINPKWKGKIIMFDPTIAGSTSANFSFILTKIYGPEAGKKYLAQLAQQEPVIMRDKRLTVEWVARGKYAISVGPNLQTVTEFKKAGAPIRIPVEKEGYRLAASSSCFGLVARPVHPNAATVLVNWLLTADAGAILSQAWGAPSVRVDVPTTGLDPARLPVEGVPMFLQDEEQILYTPTAQDIAQQIFGPLMK